MFWLNLHLDLLVWSSAAFAAGYLTGRFRTRYTRRKKK